MEHKELIYFEKNIITNPETALQYEWLETNGLGAYAMSNIYCCHSRKYHGLLIAPLEDRNEKISFLSKYTTTVEVQGTVFELSTNHYPNLYHPTGHKYMHCFTYEHSYPQIHYKIGDLEIKKSILMLHEQNTVLVRYDVLRTPSPMIFHNNPMLTFRDVNGLHKKNFATKNYLNKERGQWSIEPYEGLPKLYFKLTGNSKFFDAPDTYDNVEYLKERQRGYDFSEDIFTPGVFETVVKEKGFVILQASLHKSSGKPEELWEEEIARRKKQEKKIFSKTHPDLRESAPYLLLKQKGNQYLITEKRAKKPSIIAGFPWFGEWGRDTMISVAGLTLYNDREDLFIEILKTYTMAEKNGIFPNQYSVTGENAYNCVDASLWFFRALQQYLDFHKRDEKAVSLVKKTFEKPMANILTSFYQGETPNVHVAENGFLVAGNEWTQLTWMDAEVNGQPVTPRHGHPVEINALWHLAIDLYLSLFGNKLEFLETIKKQLEASFEERYFLPEKGYLADNIFSDGRVVEELRPNQLVALASRKLISNETAKICLETIKNVLLTPVGLRTLCFSDPMYKGRCRGKQEERDSAYHQGTVWPFLLGFYTDALIRVGGKREIKSYQKHLMDLVENAYKNRGIGMLSEIYDGNPPHKHRGCPGQAWSMAEVIRSIELLKELQS